MTDEEIEMLIADALKLPASVVGDELSYGGVRQWDSLAHVNLMLRLESRLGVEIDEDTMIDLLDVPAIKAFVRDHV